MKRILRIAALLLFLLPGIAKAQWTFDIVSVEAYINDHKKQRSCPPEKFTKSEEIL